MSQLKKSGHFEDKPGHNQKSRVTLNWIKTGSEQKGTWGTFSTKLVFSKSCSFNIVVRKCFIYGKKPIIIIYNDQNKL